MPLINTITTSGATAALCNVILPGQVAVISTGTSSLESTRIVTYSSDGIINSVYAIDALGRSRIITGSVSGTIVSNMITGTSTTAYYPINGTHIYDSSSTAWYNVCVPSFEYKYKPDHRKIRFERNNARKALWKSIRLFENLFGINKIQLFMNGAAFEIKGRKFNYRISKNRYGLLEHTQNPNTSHIPYKLEILKNNVVLAQGCTVFKKTPIVDQITALMLHITNGEEEHILKNCNLFNIQTEFYKDQEALEYFRSIHNKKYESDYVTREQIVGVPDQALIPDGITL